MTLREALTVIDDITSIYNIDTDEYVYSSMTRHTRNAISEEALNLIVDEIFSDCGINIYVRNN